MADDGDRRRMLAIGQRIESWDVVVRWMGGWETRGLTWARVPVGIIDHHDASSIKSGEWGALGDILANNKAQLQVGRCLDGVPKVAIVAAGRSAHAGVGSWVFPDGLVIPTNDGNAWLYGVEKANNGLGEPTSDAFDYATDATLRAVLEVCG